MLQISHFASHYQVIAPDLRGHGQSDKIASSYAISELAKDMALLLDALDIKAAHVVGLSLGSFVALQLALDYPQKVKSLTLAGSTSSVLDIGYYHLLSRKLLLSACPMSLVAKAVARTCFPREDQKKLRSLCVARLAANDKRAYKKIFNEIMRFDVTKRLDEIRCPVLLIAGDTDTLVPKVHAARLKERLASAELVIIKNGGHITPIDSPQAFNSALEAYLVRIQDRR